MYSMCVNTVRFYVAQGSEFSGDGYTDYQESVANGSQKVSASQPRCSHPYIGQIDHDLL